MRSVLVCLVFGVIVCDAVNYSVVIDSSSCGSSYVPNKGDEISMEYDGRWLPEDCWIDFSIVDILKGDICFKPEKFSIYQDTGIKVEYHKDLITSQADEEFDYYKPDTSNWCDSATQIFVVFLSGDSPSPNNADIKIIVRLDENGIGDTLDSIGYTVLGIIIGVVVLVIASCLIAISFCFRHKPNRGQVFRQPCGTTASSYPMTQQIPQAGYPSAQPYPAQAGYQPPTAYPSQPQGYPQAGYQPQSGHPTSTQAGYHPQSGYPQSTQAGKQPGQTGYPAVPQQSYAGYQQQTAEKVERTAPPPPYST